jgi:Lon protease-like protein
MGQVLPIFVLDTVLLPGQALPLHIFEPRYRQMLDDVRAEVPATLTHPGFGVLAWGHRPDQPPRSDHGDVGAVDSQAHLAEVGTVADIIGVEAYPDGRSDLLTVGSRRFQVLELQPATRPYLQARVEWLPERDGEISTSLLAAAGALCERYLGALGHVTGRDLSAAKFATEPGRLSYQITGELRITNPERQQLLQAESAQLRLRNAMAVLRREITLLANTRSVPVSPRVLRVEPGAN